MNESTQAVSKYDRQYSAMHDICICTKPTTVKSVETLTGKSESFIIETCRHAELGDFVFIEYLDEAGVVRLALPPKVTNTIAAHRESLTKRRRSLSSRRIMKERMAAGWKPTPPKRKRVKT